MNITTSGCRNRGSGRYIRLPNTLQLPARVSADPLIQLYVGASTQFVAQGGTQRRFPWGDDEDCETCAPPQDNTSREPAKPYPVSCEIYSSHNNCCLWILILRDDVCVCARARARA